MTTRFRIFAIQHIVHMGNFLEIQELIKSISTITWGICILLRTQLSQNMDKQIFTKF